MSLVPFVFGHGPWARDWRDRVPAMRDCDDAAFVDVLAPSSPAFFHLLLAGNARAFGGMAIPAWVQLDCATLPSAMVGFAQRARDVDPALRADLCRRAGLAAVDDDALVPLAEFCALSTPQPGHVVGFSLFSLLPGLGLRAKALGLYVQQATTQTGITQIDNGALRTHCRFGPLVVQQVGVQVHSKPGTTLIYTLTSPAPSTLSALADGSLTRVDHALPTERIPREALRAGDVLVDVDARDAVVAQRPSGPPA
ncbi:MAG: hypothetical protein FJ137_17240 [Deltaproteobacteria bacterium]|nr:hypothetical protein [Deltaproteobacteria bacterium]